MWSFAVAVVGASLMGSLHCVGMCGPFALWATGDRRTVSVVSGYHLGRLTTYLSAGLAAGLIGSSLTVTGRMAGFQSLAALAAGIVLVAVGTLRLGKQFRWWRTSGQTGGGSAATVKGSRIAGWLHAAKPLIASRGPIGRAYLGGLLTTWLPCGWLYLFVLVAGGTGHVTSSLIVMFAFWIGTLPALSGLIYGAHSLAARYRSAVPVVTSILLIVAGLYTATGRASANLAEMKPEAAAAPADPIDLSTLHDEPLPCCRSGE
ncbi:sulfite exporter TauE/SafE family protein [Roseiconus nitratireducens]|uniref:Sulfite exporter TauE/SafE family protein n=1 Tax=Roseiconus nitratireducens TaxID=2605748 RepID=A0A5M6DCC2_9BACT|nr:sulfite exporter TauE/SafE family protein [Roseiconus nitratireducens]KAA5545207.1 sulfite exporter TauE/SafE family protein [Roseiconus nitratireducens]